MTNKEFTWAKAKALDWKNYLPPARPSISELAVIEKYLVKLVKSNPKKIFKAAILGCTVEYRDLAHKYGMNVTLIDISQLHYKILSKQHLFYPGPERLIIADWKKMKITEKFDIILGDLATNMLSYKDRDLMLKNVSNMLDSNGVFISRNWIKPHNSPADFAAVVKLVRKKFPLVNFYVATAGFVYPAYINNSGFTDIDKLKADLKNLKNKKLISNTEYKCWHDRLKSEIKGINVISLNSFNRQFSRHFRIISIQEGIDIFSDKLKIHFLEKKL